MILLPFIDLPLKTPGEMSMNMHCAAYHCIWTLYNIYIVYIDPLNSVRLYLGEVFFDCFSSGRSVVLFSSL